MTTRERERGCRRGRGPGSTVTRRAVASGLAIGSRLALGCALMLGGFSPLTAQSRVRTQVDPPRATVGDRITMTVSVEHARGARAQWPDSLDLAPFEVLDARVSPSRETDSGAVSGAIFTLAAFELGELEIPSFEVTVVGADGASEILATDRYGVEIVSVGADESGDIRDIREPVSIPLGALRVLLWVLLPLLLAALLYFVARRLRPREEVRTAIPALPPLARPAHEIALAALAELEASALLERGQVKEYHIEVSDILRRYVEGRFRVDALEMTTREVLVGLERRDVDEKFRDGLRAFLDQCDLVKFAKVRPAADASRQVLELGRRLVLSSAPRYPPVDGPEAAEDRGLRDTAPAAAGGGA